MTRVTIFIPTFVNLLVKAISYTEFRIKLITRWMIKMPHTYYIRKVLRKAK